MFSYLLVPEGVAFPLLPPDLAPVVLGQFPPANPLGARPPPGLPAFEPLPAAWPPPICPPLLLPPLLIAHLTRVDHLRRKASA
jgi:hypothetical protein